MNQIMYIGPRIPGVVRRNQVFLTAPEEIMAKAQEVSKMTKYLFVRMDDIVEKKTELSSKGSVLHTAYREVERQVKEEKNELPTWN